MALQKREKNKKIKKIKTDIKFSSPYKNFWNYNLVVVMVANRQIL